MIMECKVTARKSHYPKEGPFVVPSEWALSTVKDVFTINPKNSAADELLAGFVPMASISDGFSNSFEYDNRTWKEIKSGFTHFADGDVAVAKISPCLENRKSFVARNLPNGIGSGTTELFVFRSRIILPEFTLLFFKSAYFISACVGTFNGVVGQQRAARNVIEDLVFPIPPLQEQKRIVKEVKQLFDRINEIDHGRLDIKASIEKAKSKILSLAIQGKIVPQNPAEEPAVELLRRINPAFIPSHNLHYEGILPSGWTLCCLEDVLDYEQPQAYIVNSTDYSDDYKTPVLTPGKSFVLGHTNELSGICNHLPVIIFDDFTTESKYVDFPFKVKSSAMKILRARGEINLKYVAIFMSITRLVGDTHKRYWISEYSKIPIPIPPLREQGRIVIAAKHLLNQLDNLIACISDN